MTETIRDLIDAHDQGAPFGPAVIEEGDERRVCALLHGGILRTWAQRRAHRPDGASVWVPDGEGVTLALPPEADPLGSRRADAIERAIGACRAPTPYEPPRAGLHAPSGAPTPTPTQAAPGWLSRLRGLFGAPS